jgi:DinB family protein
VAFSAATALDEVRAGKDLQSVADGRTLEEIIGATHGAKTALRLGVEAMDEDSLRRGDPWTIAMIVGHALRADEAAHHIVRSLARGIAPMADAPPYDEPGDASSSKAALLGAIAASADRLLAVGSIGSGGLRHRHRDLGELDARGWLLFIGVHDAMHLHQAAGTIRRAPR